uniref:Uncharacterized protein n=1 Tax=Triticum urartu TaxID=4572 RepID=A0A8R7QMC4_TRIUA
MARLFPVPDQIQHAPNRIHSPHHRSSQSLPRSRRRCLLDSHLDGATTATRTSSSPNNGNVLRHRCGRAAATSRGTPTAEGESSLASLSTTKHTQAGEEPRRPTSTAARSRQII